jgi:hypothetical protein
LVLGKIKDKEMRKYLLIVSLIVSSQIFAQTGIGTTTPNASAKLDVYATNKGFLPPRVTLTSATDATTIASPAEGLLVYNLGSVGLQAGYYYWNGANWATIATATSAGNGVTASDMVKLYSKGYSNATPDSTIANATGYKFTVPVSGRYLFDFSSSGYLNQATMTFTFKVRQGTTDIGTDVFSNANNNVHVVFDGKVEVNLQAGVTYNVYVTTTGSRDAGDYDRVFYKLIAGNLPVTGQSVDYVSVTRTTDLTVNTGDIVKFNSINAGNIPYDATTGKFSLTAGKTYKLSASISLSNGNTSISEASVVWKNAAGDALPNKAEILSSSHATNAGGNAFVEVFYTPTLNTTVNLYVAYATPSAILWNSFTYANIEQIGSSAFVNPWTLSGTSTYNTTGNVGIGNNTPSQALDVTGSGKFSTSIINSGNRTYFGKDGSNMHWFATNDAISETNNLGYGFESNGSSVQSHRWNIGGSERMRINSSGNVGIGTSSPGRKLHVQTSDQSSVYIESTTSDNNGMVILNANTNLNWANGWHEFLMFQNQGSTIGQVVQTNASTINYATTSDYRLKTDFKSFKGLDLVNKIKTYDYAWKIDSSRMYGVKAHELQLVLPYLVSGKKDEVDKDGKIIPQTVDYGKLTPVLVKAIQEQDSTIKNQAIEIQKLNKEKAGLEKSIIDIQRRLLKLENKKN